jgi:hypothetical protein
MEVAGVEKAVNVKKAVDVEEAVQARLYTTVLRDIALCGA